MKERATQAKKSKRFRLGCWAFIGLLLVLVCIGCVVVLTTLSHSARTAEQNEVRLALRDAIPLEPSSLGLRPPLKPSDNAAPLYLEATHALPSSKETFRIFDEFRKQERAGSMTASQIALAREHLGVFEPAAKLAEQAAARPVYYFDRSWDKSLTSYFPQFSGIRTLATFECYQAELAAHEHNLTEVFRRLAVAEKISAHIGADPVVLSSLVSRGVDLNVLFTLADCLRINENDPGTVNRARKFVDSLPPTPNLRRLLGGQLVLTRAALHSLTHLTDREVLEMMMVYSLGPPMIDHWIADGFRSPEFRNAMDTRIIRSYRVLLENLPKDESDWASMEKAAALSGDTLQDRNELAAFGGSIFLMRFHGLCLGATRTIALRRMATVMVRLAQIRISDGSLPRRLPDMGATSLDPFTGKPFRYIQKGNGFKLYFVVPGRKDNNGDYSKGDYVFDLSAGKGQGPPKR